jgi:hypothetical protein
MYQSLTQVNNGTPARIQYCQQTTMTGLPQPVLYFIDYCSTRVWFHQYANGSGWSHCFSPDFSDYFGVVTIAPAIRYPGNIQITSNPSFCS